MARHVICDCSVGARFTPARWKIRKSHSGSLDNPAVLMFPRIPLTRTSLSRPIPLSLSFSFSLSHSYPSRSLYLTLFIPRLPFELDVLSLSSRTRRRPPMIPKAPLCVSNPGRRRDASRRVAPRWSREERQQPVLNPDIWCAAVTCKSGQSPVPLRFQIFKVCLDSRRAVTRSLEDCRHRSDLGGSTAWVEPS